MNHQNLFVKINKLSKLMISMSSSHKLHVQEQSKQHAIHFCKNILASITKLSDNLKKVLLTGDD